jgi:hypothetical protein
MRVFNVHFLIRKGLGPDYMPKVLNVALDDLPEDLTEWEIRDMAKNKAEEYLYNNEDFKHYGKNWIHRETVAER